MGVYTHVFASAVALALGPVQFSARLRAARPGLHRWLGRLYLGVGVLVGGGAGLFMAFHASGGLGARLGFACLAALWLYTGFRAYRAIRARDVAAHRRWMVRNFALTFAAVTLRLWIWAFPLRMLIRSLRGCAGYPTLCWLNSPSTEHETARSGRQWPPSRGTRRKNVKPPMHIRRLSSRLIAYAWAAPNTLLGLAVGLVMLCLGGRLHFVAGVAEFHGGWLGRIVAKAPQSVGFGAMTLGHAIVGIDQTTLCALRAHEHAHVRQFEAVGAVLFAGLRVVQFLASRQRPQRPRQQLF